MKKLAMIATLICFGTIARAQQLGAAEWIAAPWSTARDGAEADGSKPMPIFRREFAVKSPVKKAQLRIAGLGQFEATLDSRLIGTPGLHQAWTDYRKTVMVESYDLSAAVHPGHHAIGVMLGNGMYNVQKSLQPNAKPRYTKFEGSFGPPKLLAELQLTYADGHIQTIVTDTRWKVTPGPVLFSSTYGGEDFDARKQQAGWDAPGFDDAAWSAAMQVDGPGGTLAPAVAPEVVRAEHHVPIKVTDLGGGRVVYDLGQNSAAIPIVQLQAPAGTTLKLTPGELLKPDGTVSQASSGAPMWWSYTSSAIGPTSWTPKFGYYGFRYIQAEWIGPPGRLLSLASAAMHSNSPIAGTFESSNATLNSIHKLIVEAMHSNEATIFSDCPHREKLGWLEETHLVAPGLIFNNDLQGLYGQTALNIRDAQKPNGMVPTTAPQYAVFGGNVSPFDDSPEWGSAAVLAPWAAYRFYGDKAELERSYPTMQAWLKYLEGKSHNGIVAYGLGDWYDIGPGEPGLSKQTTLGVTGTLMLYEDALAMSEIAAALGHAQDATAYASLAARVKFDFNQRFWNEAAGWYDKGSQTANAMPLALGVVPENRRPAVLAHLVDDLRAHNYHITTGEVGYAYMLRALTDAKRSDIIMSMLMRPDPPSYGSQLAAGATALTEAWDANPRSSQDHFMLGGAEEWFYRGLAGIDLNLSRSVPSQRLTIHPHLVDGVDWVRCGYASSLGKIESDWKRSGTNVTFTLTLPVRTTVILPDRTTVVGPGTHRFLVNGMGNPHSNPHL